VTALKIPKKENSLFQKVASTLRRNDMKEKRKECLKE
jgi:hypothetical protein